MTSLRAGLLDGCCLALAGAAPELGAGLEQHEATVHCLDPATAADEDAAAAWVRSRPDLRALVHDSRTDFARDGLGPTLERAWICARALATQAFIPSGAGGRLIFIAPPAQTAALAEAARAALENLARTLGVEWARHQVTAVTLCPGPDTGEADLLTLTAYLLCTAGAYFTGARFDLGLAPASATG